jgi:hypothetical protein
MPHGASKRIRAKYNNVLVKRPTHPLKELAFVIYVGTGSLRKLAAAALAKVRSILWSRSLHRRPDQSPTARGVSVELRDSRGSLLASGHLIDIDDQELSFCSQENFNEQTCTIILRRTMRGGKRRHGKCIARVRKQAEGDANDPVLNAYVASYTTASDYQKYLMDTYFAQLRFAAF